MVKGTMDVAALAKKLSEKLRERQRFFYFDLTKMVFMFFFLFIIIESIWKLPLQIWKLPITFYNVYNISGMFVVKSQGMMS